MRALILAAGLGTRLKPFTDSHPKALLPLAGRPLLDYQVSKLQAAGLTDIYVNIHHHADELESYIRTHYPTLHISDERSALLETGGAIRKLGQEHPSDEPLLVLNVDILSNLDLTSLMAAHQPENYATLVVSQRETQRYLCFNENENEPGTPNSEQTGLHMVGWTNIATGEKKPAELNIDASTRLLAFSGLHILSPRAIRDMVDWPERFSITDYYIERCTREHIVPFIPTDYRMMDVGKTEQLTAAEAFAKAL